MAEHQRCMERAVPYKFPRYVRELAETGQPQEISAARSWKKCIPMPKGKLWLFQRCLEADHIFILVLASPKRDDTF